MASFDFARRRPDPVQRDVRWMVVVLLICGLLLFAGRALLPQPAIDERPWVEVSGEGVTPGVYRGETVGEVLAQAGWNVEDGHAVADGDHLRVDPSGIEIRTSERTLLVHLPLDLNTASVEQLDAIPGISPRTAQAIVDERQARGPFYGHEELARVRIAGHAREALIAFTVADLGLRPAFDLNSASADELTLLDGIGPVLAERIVASRPYAAVDELVRVEGVGESTLARIRSQLTVNP